MARLGKTIQQRRTVIILLASATRDSSVLWKTRCVFAPLAVDVFRLLQPEQSLVRITFHGLRDSGGRGRRGELIMSSGVQVTLNVAAVGKCGATVGVGTVSGSTGRVGLPGDLGGSRDIGACCDFVSALLVVKELQ